LPVLSNVAANHPAQNAPSVHHTRSGRSPGRLFARRGRRGRAAGQRVGPPRMNAADPHGSPATPWRRPRRSGAALPHSLNGAGRFRPASSGGCDPCRLRNGPCVGTKAIHGLPAECLHRPASRAACTKQTQRDSVIAAARSHVYAVDAACSSIQVFHSGPCAYGSTRSSDTKASHPCDIRVCYSNTLERHPDRVRPWWVDPLPNQGVVL